jgi:ABC-2 type transport system permease protein
VLTRRELSRVLRQPSRVVATVATPLLLWVLLASGFSRSFQAPADGAAASGAGYGAYLLPGVLTMTVLFTSIFGAISMIEDRREGFLQSVLVSPAPRWAIAASKLLGSSIVATLQAAVLLPAAFAVGEGFGPGGLIQCLAALMCTALGITGIGLAAAWWIDSVQGFHGVMNIVLFPMWLLSGSLFPLEGASGWMRALMMANPVTWCTRAMHSALGGSGHDAALAWGVTAAFGALGVALGWATLGRGVRRL